MCLVTTARVALTEHLKVFSFSSTQTARRQLTSAAPPGTLILAHSFKLHRQFPE